MHDKAIRWALTEAPVTNMEERAVLAQLAVLAWEDETGVHSAPGRNILARRSMIGERGVRRHLTAMRYRGLVTVGDPTHVVDVPAGHRPIVWDLHLDQRSLTGGLEQVRAAAASAGGAR